MKRNGREQVLPIRGSDRSGYAALATDGDGTLLLKKHMARATVAAIERLRASGRKVILATGETQDDLAEFPNINLFDLVVAEDGALLYWPRTRKSKQLAGSPSAAFVRELRKRGVEPRSVGKVVVSVAHPDVPTMGEVIRDLGMGWRLVPNRKQVMALPPGVDKGTGLAAALKTMGLSPAQVVGAGDAENDLAMMLLCGCGAAVASAVPLLRGQADVVTEGGTGRGIVELVGRMIAGELPPPAVREKAGGSAACCG
jgi:hydroxymethylpyrimidine pyrophosphatase-like HAD family hydrolase